MSENGEPSGTCPSVSRKWALARIAELLGCPPEALMHGAGPADLRDASELLGLWYEIEDEDRAALLAYARALAER